MPMIYNPTDLSLYVTTDAGTYQVMPRATVEVDGVVKEMDSRLVNMAQQSYNKTTKKT